MRTSKTSIKEMKNKNRDDMCWRLRDCILNQLPDSRFRPSLYSRLHRPLHLHTHVQVGRAIRDGAVEELVRKTRKP
jgi:hypothetical protein